MPSYIRTRTEFAVNSFTAGSQAGQSVSTFADGGFVVAWVSSDPGQDGDNNAIKAQLFNSSGGKVGTEFLVNSVGTGAQFSPSVATLANGSFVVAWVTNDPAADGSGNAIKAQLYDRQGSPLGGEFLVNSQIFGSQFTPNVAALAGGGFVISWDDWNGFDMKAQIFSASGAKVGAEFRLNTNAGGAEEYGDIVGLAGGGFVATWRTTDTSADGSNDAVKAQVFSATGAKVGTEFLVNSQKTGWQYEPSVAALANGGFVIVWQTTDSAQDGSDGAIKGQMYSASGVKVGGEFLVNSFAANLQMSPAVTATPDGGFVVAWQTLDPAQDGSGSAIKAQAFDAGGAKVGAEMLVNSLAAGAQFAPDLATLADGRVIVTWASASGDLESNSIRAQILGTQAAPPLPNESPVIISNGGGASASIVHDERALAVTRVVASDDGEPNNLRYSITGGGDAALFRIDALTGILSFAQPPQYVPGGDNDYSVTVTASDGLLTDTQSIQVSVRNLNEVVIVSDGGGEYAQVYVDENQTEVTVVAAADLDGLALTYSIVEGDGYEGYLFTIDAQTGALRFNAAPDYESPEDVYRNHVYYVQVRATDGTVSDSQIIAVQVNDVDEPEGFAIISDGGGDHAELHVAENSLAVTIVAVSGAAGPVTYEIVGGPHAGWFEIDPATGALAFVGPPDYETGPYGYYDPNYPMPYGVTVRASDGVSYDEQQLVVIVEDVDEAPVFSSFDGAEHVGMIVTENDVDLGYVWASDPDRYGWVTYGLEGPDAAFFQVDPYSGEFRFIQAPDYEAWADADGDNVYEVSVVAYSGMLSAVQSFSFTVYDLYEPVTIVSDGGGDDAYFWLPENGVAVTFVEAFGGSGRLSYEIVGGADASYFGIDPYSGMLRFAAPPNFEWTADFDHDNVYEVIVRASDGATSDDQRVWINLQDVDDDPQFYDWAGGEPVGLWVIEGRDYVGDLLAFDEDGGSGPVTYAVTGGADAAHFAIDPETGSLTLADVPDFEDPTDADGDNVYEVEITASAGDWSRSQAFSVTVVNENERPRITSNGGGTSASISMDEGQTSVTTVASVDDGPNPVTYSITGGAHADLFAIDPVTGALSFIAAPDYEAPAGESSNFYTVYVTASDGELSSFQMIQVTVNDVNEGVTITTGPALSVDEDSAFVARIAAIDGDGDPLGYSIVGGADAAHFVIDPATGDLTLAASLDFEAPADADGDNVYEVTVRASDGQLHDDRQMSITVNDVNDTVEITSYGGADSVSLTIPEAGYFQVADVDASLSPFWGTRFTIGGADAALFTVDPISGQLSFKYPFFPDFEAPGDADGDNVYHVVVTASTATSSDSQAFAITVTDRNEGLWITSDNGGDASLSLDEGGRDVTIVTAFDMDGDVPTYSIAGGPDAALFAIDPVTGALTFIAAPDHEAPGDSDGNNVYRVTVAASDGEFTASQNLSITVGNVNEGVTITSNGGGAAASVSVAENGTAVATVAATDPDGGPVSYAIVGGADAARFTIDAATGALAFVSAPDFEAPTDSGGDNVYDVVVSASDGSFADTQAIAVTVTNVNEAPVITSNGAGAGASVSVAENGTTVATVAATDADGGSVTYAIVGGADAARFTIDAATGALAFVSAPDFEAPADAGGNNVYDVVVAAGDGSFTDTQALAVTVTNVNEAPVITSNGGGAAASVSVDENSRTVTNVAAVDPDGAPAAYAIVGGADAARFTINPQTGLLEFVAAPDWETPGDSDGDNVYSVVVRAGDGALADLQTLSVSVLNLRDGNNVTGTSGGDSISATSTNPALRTTNAEDNVSGQGGHDTILGLAGDDILNGNDGNDVLNGGGGADRLTGGLGKDQFVYNAASESTTAERDVITDFSRAQNDKISLSGIDANSLVSGNQAFTFIGAAAFSNVAGQLRYSASGGVTIISGDVNGDGVADFQVELTGQMALTASDFVL